MTGKDLKFPAWRYHSSLPPRLVKSRDEARTLGGDWADTPARWNIQAAAPPPVAAEEPTAAPDYDGMSADDLRALAKSRGVVVHHRAGRAKLLSILRGEE